MANSSGEPADHSNETPSADAMPPKRVALIIESMMAPRRSMLNGVARFVQEHEPWSIYLKPTFVEKALKGWIDRWNGDGIITTIREEERGELSDVDIPIVDLLGEFPDRGFTIVHTDDHAVGELGAQHLIERGFRHFAFCEFGDFFWMKSRRAGFERRLKAAGFECAIYRAMPIEHGLGGPDMWEQQQQSLMKWIAGLPKPVGVMTTNDFLGQQFLEACLRLKVHVPDAVAVIGVDNDEPICRVSSPPLSSVAIDDHQRGYEAASVLSRLMAGEPKPAGPVLIAPIGVVARASTDSFAVEDETLIQALRYLRENAYGKTGVDDIASALSVSRSALERKFRRLLGRSVNDEIVRLRLNRAVELLSETQLELKNVASRCGFSSQSYMNTVFKEHLGRTPGSYRH